MKYSLILKKYIFLIAALIVFESSAFAVGKTLYIYAGAGLRPAMDKLAARFELQENIKVRIDYGGSGQILTRFKSSHKGDLFIPGSKVHFPKLALSNDLISVQDIVTHTPVIGVYRNKSDQIKSFSDLTKEGIKVGLGDPKSMALGRTAVSIIEHSQMEKAIRENVVVQAATVKQLAMYVIRGDIDAAIIGRSDVVQNADKLSMVAIPEDWYSPEIIAVGVLSTTKQPELSKRFADLLTSQVGISTFVSLGFLPYIKTAQ